MFVPVNQATVAVWYFIIDLKMGNKPAEPSSAQQ
jgi:hypothetical protein